MPLDAIQKTIRDAICSGCRTYEASSGCIVKPIYNSQRCPCSKCLIKMMCIERCEKLKKYTGYHTTKK